MIVPGLTAEVLTLEEDETGFVPALVSTTVVDETGNVPKSSYLPILLSEWSPIPLGTWDGPEEGFLVIADDGSIIDVVSTETTAKAVLNAAKGYGYVPVRVQVHSLVTRKV